MINHRDAGAVDEIEELAQVTTICINRVNRKAPLRFESIEVTADRLDCPFRQWRKHPVILPHEARSVLTITSTRCRNKGKIESYSNGGAATQACLGFALVRPRRPHLLLEASNLPASLGSPPDPAQPVVTQSVLTTGLSAIKLCVSKYSLTESTAGMDSTAHSDIEAEEARTLLADAGYMRRATRRELQAHGWQWYIVWAIVTAGASASTLTAAGGWYWLVAAPLGMAATVAVCQREDRRSGVQRQQGPYWLIGGAIALINFAAGALLPVETVVVIVWVVFGFGFVAFAWLDNQPTIAVLFALLALAVAMAGVVVPDPVTLYVVVGLVYAATMTGVAIGIRSLGTTL